MKANLEIKRGLVWIFIKGGRKTAMQTASKKSICKCFCMKLNYPNYRYIVGGAGQPTCMKETFFVMPQTLSTISKKMELQEKFSKFEKD